MDDLDRLIQTLPEDEPRAVEKRSDELATHNLRELRALAGLTQEDVSAATGFKQANVSRLESVPT